MGKLAFDYFCIVKKSLHSFAYPVYTIGRSLRSQWREKAVYIWDIFLLLFFVAVALLVAAGQLYVRQEWLDAFFDRR